MTDAGIESGPVEPGRKPPFYPRAAVTGSAVKTPWDLPRPAHRWTFDEGLKPHEDKVVDAATGTDCPIAGLSTLFMKGVSGTALALDGYYTGVAMEAEGRSHDALTVEAWAALDAYPYNIAPFVHQSKGFGKEGWYLGLDAYGHPLVTVAGVTVTASNVVLPLHAWTHVAATLGHGKIRLYVDGREVAAGVLAEPLVTPATPILIGRNNEKNRCTDAVRGGRSNLEFVYGIQGLLDEVSIYDEVLSPDLVQRAYQRFLPSDRRSALAAGVLPGEVGPAEQFGAVYKTLHFSDIWDGLWRDPPGSEIVVKFDKIPCSVVYWRGTNYSPNWVTDNNRWMADQSSETGGPHGCSEHMADKQLRHCHARIIENTPARVVIHWRYPCVDVGYVSLGPGNWTDEYHTIYPDGTGLRKLVWNGAGRAAQFPGHPIPHQSRRVGPRCHEFAGHDRRQPEGRKQQVDLGAAQSSAAKYAARGLYRTPEFQVAVQGLRDVPGRPYQSLGTPRALQVHSRPLCRSWNHWPMHLVPSDGRFAVANDRVTHFALGANDESPGMVMYGFTKDPIATLVPLARMWRNPPPLTDLRGGIDGGFDKGQKAFLIEATGTQVSFTIAASDQSPLVNPCFVIRNFGRREATVRIDGKLSTAVRQGTIVDTDGARATVIWMDRQCASPARFTMEAAIDRRPARNQATAAEETTVPLAGTWRFRLDPENVGVADKWFARDFDDTVQLPGTTDENRKGVKKDEQCVDRLSRVWYWKGPAWYQRRVTIPDTWKGQRITLLLERSKNTRVWVDQTFCGGEDTLSAPQRFDVTGAMTPGKHTLTVLVDNARLPPVGPAHAVDERTQTNWNGIVGRIELRATDPGLARGRAGLSGRQARNGRSSARSIGNVTGKAASGRITVQCESYHVASRRQLHASKSFDVNAPLRQTAVELTYEPAATCRCGMNSSRPCSA